MKLRDMLNDYICGKMIDIQIDDREDREDREEKGICWIASHEVQQ